MMISALVANTGTYSNFWLF